MRVLELLDIAGPHWDAPVAMFLRVIWVVTKIISYHPSRHPQIILVYSLRASVTPQTRAELRKIRRPLKFERVEALQSEAPHPFPDCTSLRDDKGCKLVNLRLHLCRREYSNIDPCFNSKLSILFAIPPPSTNSPKHPKLNRGLHFIEPTSKKPQNRHIRMNSQIWFQCPRVSALFTHSLNLNPMRPKPQKALSPEHLKHQTPEPSALDPLEVANHRTIGAIV